MKLFLTIVLPLYLAVFAMALRLFVADSLWLWRHYRGLQSGPVTEADAEEYARELRTVALTEPPPNDGPRGAVEVSPLGGRGGTQAPAKPRPGLAPPAPLQHNERDLRVPRLRTHPLVLGLNPAPVMTRSETPVFAWEGTPIYDALVEEIAARNRALRWKTAEVRTVFDALVDRWLCTWCESGDCLDCPGCSCSCKLPALIGRPPLVEVA